MGLKTTYLYISYALRTIFLPSVAFVCIQVVLISFIFVWELYVYVIYDACLYTHKYEHLLFRQSSMYQLLFM